MVSRIREANPTAERSSDEQTDHHLLGGIPDAMIVRALLEQAL
jgi:hypothetical protein